MSLSSMTDEFIYNFFLSYSVHSKSERQIHMKGCTNVTKKGELKAFMLAQVWTDF